MQRHLTHLRRLVAAPKMLGSTCLLDSRRHQWYMHMCIRSLPSICVSVLYHECMVTSFVSIFFLFCKSWGIFDCLLSMRPWFCGACGYANGVEYCVQIDARERKTWELQKLGERKKRCGYKQHKTQPHKRTDTQTHRLTDTGSVIKTQTRRRTCRKKRCRSLECIPTEKSDAPGGRRGGGALSLHNILESNEFIATDLPNSKNRVYDRKPKAAGGAR
jgi:hypothetical protein